MRSEENPLDLNNLPEDYYTKDGKLVVEDSSSYAAGFAGGGRKKKSGGKEGKDECGKVYECRFCSLKFCKSQALGGHMNRHRQERETETLNRARQLVFNNDNTLLSQSPYLGGQSIAHGGGVGYQYHHHHHHGDPTLQTFRSIYPSSSSSSSTAAAARLFSATATTGGGGSSSTSIFPPPPPPPPPYMYSSPSSSSRFIPFTSTNEYLLGHVLPHTTTTTTTTTMTPSSCGPQQEMMMIGNNYTCIGAPVSNNGGREIMTSSSSSANYIHQYHNHNHNHNHDHDHEEGLMMSWGSAGRSSCTGAGTQQQRLDPSSINRFQDGF